MQGLFQCYRCFKILLGSAFKRFNLSDLPGFDVGGRRASNALRDIGGTVCKHHDSGITWPSSEKWCLLADETAFRKYDWRAYPALVSGKTACNSPGNGVYMNTKVAGTMNSPQVARNRVSLLDFLEGAWIHLPACRSSSDQADNSPNMLQRSFQRFLSRLMRSSILPGTLWQL
jgi:hypothetical protein